MGDLVADDVHAVTDSERDEAAIRSLGQDHFDALTPEEQDAKFGPTIAAALRDGTIKLSDLVDKKGDFLVRTPIDELNLPQDQNS